MSNKHETPSQLQEDEVVIQVGVSSTVQAEAPPTAQSAGQKKDGYHETTQEDLDSVEPMSVTQKIIIAAALVVVVVVLFFILSLG